MKSNSKKIIVLILIFSMLLIANPSPARADFWGASMMATTYQITTEQMLKSIMDTLLANLKIAAIRIIQSRLDSLLGSQSGSNVPGVAGYIISDWKMFIYGSATRYSDMVLTDFFRQVNAGATTAIKKNILTPVERAINADPTNIRPDLQYFCPGGDASKAFDKGTRNSWMCWRMAAAPQNDVAYNFMIASSVREAAYQQELLAKQAEGIAGQGIKSKESGGTVSPGTSGLPGNSYGGVQGGTVSPGTSGLPSGRQGITTPGSIIGDLMSEINNMPIRMLSLARTIPEVATAMVNQMLSQVIQQGATNIIEGKNAGNSNMGQQFNSQMQSLIQNGVRNAASPNTFFGR